MYDVIMFLLFTGEFPERDSPFSYNILTVDFKSSFVVRRVVRLMHTSCLHRHRLGTIGKTVWQRNELCPVGTFDR